MRESATEKKYAEKVDVERGSKRFVIVGVTTLAKRKRKRERERFYRTTQLDTCVCVCVYMCMRRFSSAFILFPSDNMRRVTPARDLLRHE